ncbi:MAG: hypothetical protein CMP75_05155 [Flavobacteriales bacterium]|nr:hypothetical protein [Flavobacteriales bacterium]|tara:strand:- start:48 stop:1880 length:1833 start_codon:yes stop_codon:yes gene_type:complete
MRRFIFNIIFCPTLLFAQEFTIQVPEVDLIDNRLDLHKIGTQQLYIDSTLIKNSNSLSDLLRQYGPIFVKEYGALSTAFFRGTPAAYTQLLWNGIPLNSLSTGIVDLGLFPTNIFSEIKLNSGGSSTLSGSGAISGSIQLNNSLDYNPNYKFEVDLIKGSFGLEKKSFSYQFGDGVNALHFQYLTSVSQNDFDYINNGLPNSPMENQEHAYKASKQYLLNYGYRNNKLKLGFHLWKSDNFREVPVGMLSSNPNALQWDDVFRTKVFWKQSGRDYQLELAHAYLEEDFRYNSNFVDSKLEAKNHFSSFEYQHHYKFLSTFFGINLQQRLVSSNYYSKLTDDELLVGYASFKFSKNKWNIVTSIRGESHSLYDVPSLYSFGSNYLINNNLTWKFQFAKNFKAPAFNDLYWIGDGAIGNKNLLPEISYTTEASIVNNIITLTFYSNFINQMIRWQPNSSDVWTPQNLESVWARGLEFKRKLNKKIGRLKISNISTYSFTLSTLEESNIENDARIGVQLSYVPIHKTTSVTHLDLKEWRLTVSSSYNGKVNTTSDGVETLPSYLLVDLGLQYQSNKTPIIIGAKINNVTNKSYQVFSYYPMPGRHISLNLNLKI